VKIETKFDIWEKVSIIALDFHLGTVIEIKIDGNNFYYGIEYWYNGEIKTVHLNENEIEKYKEKKI
jgi:hypothetical protein